MTDPDRLSDGEAGIGSHLLRSARADAPSRRARIRTAAALGVAVGGAAAGTTATAAASASASKVGAYGSTLALVKWFGLGALGATLALGAAESVMTPATPSKAVATSRSAAARPSGKPLERNRVEARVPAPPASTLAPAPMVAPGPTVATSPLANASAPAVAVVAPPIGLPSSPPHATAVASSLADELRALDRASAELAAGNPRAALDALDAHEVFFKDGALGPEAAVLRIEALAANGEDDEATRSAHAFLSADPDSVQARRVRSVLSAIEARRKP